MGLAEATEVTEAPGEPGGELKLLARPSPSAQDTR